MGQKFKVKASATMPISKASWEVDVGDDPKDVLIYTNLAYDLVAYAMGRLGVAMSEHVLGDDTKLNALACEVNGRVE